MAAENTKDIEGVDPESESDQDADDVYYYLIPSRWDFDPIDLSPSPEAVASIEPPPVNLIDLQYMNNPLLLPEILNQVFQWLGPKELASCFDVCQLWREETYPHGARARSSWPPVIIQNNISDPNFVAYKTSIRSYINIFGATKYCFRNTDLGSSEMSKFMDACGWSIHQLELHYFVDRMNGTMLSFFLRRKLPNLQTLIITKLPRHIADENLFPVHDDGDIWLTSIEICLNRYSFEFLVTFFVRCPALNQLTIKNPAREEFTSEMRMRHQRPAVESLEVLIIIKAARQANRLRTITSLKLSIADFEVLDFLNRYLSPNQLHTFHFGDLLPPGDEMAVNGGGNQFNQNQTSILQQLLTSQSNSLENLQISASPSNMRQVLPPMPNLVELRICKLFSYGDHEAAGVFPLLARGALNYTIHFPRLRVLGLQGLLENYILEEIFPVVGPPSQSVEILHQFPIGVDQPRMARIGQLFPNLKIIRAVIPHRHENILVSVWEFCPNITELFLTLAPDEGIRVCENRHFGQLERTSLDSLFSGIPELVCQHLRSLDVNVPQQERELIAMSFNGARRGASIWDLRRLKRLCIKGGGTNTLGPTSRNAGEPERDKLSNVFGFSCTWASQELGLLQIPMGLIMLSPFCIQRINERTQLELVVAGNSRYDPEYTRLTRPEFGLGVMAMEWYDLECGE